MTIKPPLLIQSHQMQIPSLVDPWCSFHHEGLPFRREVLIQGEPCNTSCRLCRARYTVGMWQDGLEEKPSFNHMSIFTGLNPRPKHWHHCVCVGWDGNGRATLSVCPVTCCRMSHLIVFSLPPIRINSIDPWLLPWLTGWQPAYPSLSEYARHSSLSLHQLSKPLIKLGSSGLFPSVWQLQLACWLGKYMWPS